MWIIALFFFYYYYYYWTYETLFFFYSYQHYLILTFWNNFVFVSMYELFFLIWQWTSCIVKVAKLNPVWACSGSAVTWHPPPKKQKSNEQHQFSIYYFLNIIKFDMAAPDDIIMCKLKEYTYTPHKHLANIFLIYSKPPFLSPFKPQAFEILMSKSSIFSKTKPGA